MVITTDSIIESIKHSNHNGGSLNILDTPPQDGGARATPILSRKLRNLALGNGLVNASTR